MEQKQTADWKQKLVDECLSQQEKEELSTFEQYRLALARGWTNNLKLQREQYAPSTPVVPFQHRTLFK